jgi:hypothetical protein
MSSSEWREKARARVGNLVIDHRGWLDIGAIALVVGAYVVAAHSKSFDDVLGTSTRSSLYNSLATTSGALLGFALTALAILVALPSTERLEALRRHSKWERVPKAFIRAAWAFLLALVLCTLGITLDDGAKPAETYEGFVLAAVALALIRILSATIALDHVMTVARTSAPLRKPIDDP